MTLIVQLIGWGVLALSLAGSAYAVAAAAAVRRMRRAPAPQSLAPVPITLLKPLCGDEAGLAENLTSFLQQDYGAPVQMVMGVQDPADPAIAVVEAVRSRHPKADLELVRDPRPHGANRKVSNLINMLAAARHETLVLSDADIRVSSGYLAGVTAALDQPGVGAVTVCYFGQGRGGAWSRMAAMGVSYGFLPNVALGAALGLAHPCMGSTIALRRAVLDRIGGFERVKDALSDDYDLGQAVRDAGLTVALPPLLVEHGCAEASLTELFAHELRWAVTIRSIDPAGHLGSLVTHAVPLALVGLACGGGWAPGVAGLAVALAARAWLKLSVDAAAGRPSGPWIMMPLRDLLSFGVFVASHFTSRVRWRDDRFVLGPDRSLSPA